MIQALLFDLDDTLLDRSRTIARFLPGHMERLRVPPELRPHYVERFHFLDQQGYGNKTRLFSELQKTFLPQRTVQELQDDFRYHAWQEPALYPGTYQALLDLRTQGMRLGVVTNGTRQSQRPKLSGARLGEYMDVMVVSEEVGVRKPDPALFLHALKKLGTAAQHSLFVGDHPERDILGAQQVGLQTAWLHHGRNWPHLTFRPDFNIDSLTELLNQLAQRKAVPV